MPKCIGASVASESPWYAAAAKNTSEAFTEILKSKKSLSSNSFICPNPLSIIASGQGSPYFSRRFFSRLPAFTPILIEQPKSLAAFITSLILKLDPMFPGLILKHAAPDSAASKALL